MNRREGDIGSRSGYLESVEWPRRGSGRYPGGQAEMSEDLGNHRGVYDGGDEGTAAMGAVFQIDIEHPVTKALPGFYQIPLRTLVRDYLNSIFALSINI